MREFIDIDPLFFWLRVWWVIPAIALLVLALFARRGLANRDCIELKREHFPLPEWWEER